jgi:hypothetical protein
MRKIRRSLFIGVPVLLLIALAGPVATSGDTAVNHSGRYGVHYLADSEEYPGVRCAYDDETVIESVRVRDPLVFTRDSNPDRVDSRWVSWKYRVQAQNVNGWAAIATSELQKRMATDAQIANFSPMRTTFAGSASTQYRVLVIIRWYGSDGTTVVGRAVHRADWYAWEGVPSFEGACPGGLF